MQATDRQHLAEHEAGHAVAAHLLGFTIDYVTIRAVTGGGQVAVRDRKTGYPLDMWATVMCAGILTEDITTDTDRADILESGRSDATYVRDIAREMHRARPGDGTVLHLAALAWTTAYQLVTSNYGAIRAVADQLLNSRRALTGPQVRRCIAAASTALPPAPRPDSATFWLPDEADFIRTWAPAPARRRARKATV